MTETAYAKINLALHVRQRREDGYHELETLFAFLDDGDRLTASPAARDAVHVKGEFAAALDNPLDNIVAKALHALPHNPGWMVSLEKRLPVAAGLGGGSADAAAIFRMVDRWGGLPDDWRERAEKLGADVPACIRSVTAIGRGTGAELEEIDSGMKGMPVLLVNPRAPLSTAAVFKAWGGKDLGPLPTGGMREIALSGRNDLESAAIRLCPTIARVLDLLRQTGPYLARMSGSGATCFAVYQRMDVLAEAAARIAAERPEWWTMTGSLR